MGRNTLRYLAILLIHAFIVCFSADVATAHQVTAQQAARETSLNGLKLIDKTRLGPRLSSLDLHFGFCTIDKRFGRKYVCGAMTPNTTARAAKTAADALFRLPAKAINMLDELDYIIICSHLMVKGRRVGGISVPHLKLMMIAVGEMGEKTSFIQSTVLHELYHFIEHRSQTYEDPEWRALFGSGYVHKYDPRILEAPLGSGKRGFLNIYAESFPQEERAELFVALMLYPGELVRHIHHKQDTVLRHKALYMIEKWETLTGYRINIRW